MTVIRNFFNLLIFCWCAGYFWFIYNSENFTLENRTITDTIIVFGKNKQRLYTGAQLVKLGYAPVMFVTGDEAEEEFTPFLKEQKLLPEQFIYDIQHANKNNDFGREAALFLANHGFNSARIVAPSYQINRAIVELKANLPPYILLIPHPVSLKIKNYNALFVEYNKFVLMLVANIFGIADEIDLSYS